MTTTPQSIVEHCFLAAGGFLIAITFILMENTNLVVEWQSMYAVKIFFIIQVFIVSQTDLMKVLIVWCLQE